MDLALCGVLYDARGRLGEGCVVARGGVIAGLREEPPGGVEVYDARGLGAVVAPAFIDIHVHLRGLGLSYKEDEATGTRAAASAGIGLVADMPNTVPRLDTVEALAAKLSALASRSVVDYAVYAAVPPSPGAVGELLRAGAIGFKVYPSDLSSRARAVEALLSTPGLLAVLHPELPEAEHLWAESERSRRALRGQYWEEAAVDYVAGIASGARVHVTHASAASTVEAARRRGFSVDTTPSYLLLPDGEGCLYKVNPPLRGPAERQRLLQLLLEGEVDAVASDHAPHSAAEKEGDPLLCPPGVAWLEHWPQALYCLVSAGALGLGDYLRLASRAPAEILGVSEAYGLLEPGMRANLVAFVEERGRTGYPRYTKAGRAPHYGGLASCMRVLYTVVGGALVYDGDRVLGGARVVNAARATGRAPPA